MFDELIATAAEHDAVAYLDAANINSDDETQNIGYVIGGRLVLGTYPDERTPHLTTTGKVRVCEVFADVDDEGSVTIDVDGHPAVLENRDVELCGPRHTDECELWTSDPRTITEVRTQVSAFYASSGPRLRAACLAAPAVILA